MERVRLYNPTEAIEVEVGDRVETIEVDFSKENMAKMGEAAKAAQAKLQALTLAEDKARGQGDGRALKSIEDKVGKMLEDFLKEVIGAAQLKKVLDMCGGKMTRGTRTMVITPLVSYIMQAVDRNAAIMNQSMAAIGMLAVHNRGGDDAQPADGAE